MKKFPLLLLLISCSSLSATTYESLDISFDKFITLSNNGNKSPRVKVIIIELGNYDEFLTGELRTDFTQLLKLADEDGYRLRVSENIPPLVSVVSGCISHAISDLKLLDSKYLDSNHIKEYAVVMGCIGFIDRLENELSDMRSANHEFIELNGFRSKTYSMWAKSFGTKRSLLDENSRFLRHLISKNEH